MCDMIESMVYDTAPGTADFALPAASKPVVAAAYASLKAAVDALNQSAACAALIDFGDGVVPGRPIRINLSMAIVKAGGALAAVSEDLYAAIPTSLDGTVGVRLDKIATLTWTKNNPGVAIGFGGRTGHCWPDLCQVAATGMLQARTGVEIAAPAGAPALATVLDIGNARGLLRLAVKDATNAPDGYAGLHERWR